MKTIRFIAALGLGLSLLLPVVVQAQMVKPACTSALCTEAEVGPFLQGVVKACGNTGDCTLRDIETVVANIGNWILGIIGTLVFAAYIYGGILWMTSGGGSEGVKKGKDAIGKATEGLVIVFIAYAGIYSLKNALSLNVPGASGGVTGDIVACAASSVGQPCGTNKECVLQGGSPVCLTRCAAQNRDGLLKYQCTDTTSLSATAKQSCTPNLCDGGAETQCCDVVAMGQSTLAEMRTCTLARIGQQCNPSDASHVCANVFGTPTCVNPCEAHQAENMDSGTRWSCLNTSGFDNATLIRMSCQPVSTNACGTGSPQQCCKTTYETGG